MEINPQYTAHAGAAIMDDMKRKKQMDQAMISRNNGKKWMDRTEKCTVHPFFIVYRKIYHISISM